MPRQAEIAKLVGRMSKTSAKGADQKNMVEPAYAFLWSSLLTHPYQSSPPKGTESLTIHMVRVLSLSLMVEPLTDLMVEPACASSPYQSSPLKGPVVESLNVPHPHPTGPLVKPAYASLTLRHNYIYNISNYSNKHPKRELFVSSHVTSPSPYISSPQS